MVKQTQTKRKPGSGGVRPGAGRPPKGPAARITTSVTLLPSELEDLRFLRSRGIDTNVILGRYIATLAAQHREALADSG